VVASSQIFHGAKVRIFFNMQIFFFKKMKKIKNKGIGKAVNHIGT
jgi:hypothetical protein